MCRSVEYLSIEGWCVKVWNTWVVALDPEEAGGESENGEFVEFGDDVLVEGQLHGEVIQFGVETFPMSFARVALLRRIVRRFRPENKM